MLNGQNAIVTGRPAASAWASPSAGRGRRRRVLNGFGKPEEIATTRAESGRDGRQQVAYSAADLSKAREVASMVEEAERRFGRSISW